MWEGVGALGVEELLTIRQLPDKKRAKSLDFESELDIAQYHRPRTVSTLPLFCLIRSSHRPVVAHEDGQYKT
ncbi:hypothetical protein J6590_037300 [Homalodisca vitripennis]|nr:hypothetical protein J6590_037300 [Homalodisca vitripennis]